MSDHSIKKKKKRIEQERSGGKAATGQLATHHESHDEEQLKEDESTDAHSQSQPYVEERLKEATTMEEKMEQLMSIVTQTSYAVNQLTDQMLYVDDRLRTLEVSRKLSKGAGYYTPKKEKKQPSVLYSVQHSSLKRDWRTLGKEGNASSEEGSDDEEEEEEEEEESITSSTKRTLREMLDNNKSKDSHSVDLNSVKYDRVPSVFRELDKSRENAKSTVVTINRQEKECNVRIENFTLSHVSKAMMKIMDFQDKEGTAVNMTKVLTNACKEHLKLVYNVTADDLKTMPLSKLFSVLAKQTKIYSKITFYSELKEALSNVKLMDWHLVNTDNHELFYFQQLNLVHEFNTIFRLMLLENSNYCPPCNDKPNGLIFLFKNYHARDYWSHLWSGMTQRYKRIDVFMEEYKEKAYEQYCLSLGLKDIPYSANRKSSEKQPDKEKSYQDAKRKIFKPKYRPSSLNHLDNNDELNEDDSSGNTWSNSNPVTTQGKKHDHESDSDSVSEAGEDSDEEEEDNEEELQRENTEPSEDPMLDKVLAAFNDHRVDAGKKLDKRDLPCLRKLMSGKCDFEGCPYGHRQEQLLKGASDMMGKLKAFISSSGVPNHSSSNSSIQIKHKEKYDKGGARK